jgi:hypothetical protein
VKEARYISMKKGVPKISVKGLILISLKLFDEWKIAFVEKVLI